MPPSRAPEPRFRKTSEDESAAVRPDFPAGPGGGPASIIGWGTRMRVSYSRPSCRTYPSGTPRSVNASPAGYRYVRSAGKSRFLGRDPQGREAGSQRPGAAGTPQTSPRNPAGPQETSVAHYLHTSFMLEPWVKDLAAWSSVCLACRVSTSRVPGSSE